MRATTHTHTHTHTPLTFMKIIIPILVKYKTIYLLFLGLVSAFLLQYGKILPKYDKSLIWKLF